MIMRHAMVPALFIALLIEPLLTSSLVAWSAAEAARPVAFVSSTLPPRPTLLTRTIHPCYNRRASTTSLSGGAREETNFLWCGSSSPKTGGREDLGFATTDGILPNGERRTVAQRHDVSLPDVDSPEFSHSNSDHSLQLVVQAATVGAVTVAAAIFLDPSDVIAASSASAELVTQASSASVDVSAIFAKAGRASIGGGASGAAAAVVQVLSLMWLRTTMNFQYKNGGSTQDALQTLWQEGGIPRFYRGLPFALVQGPLSRFGDTAANVGVLVLLEAFESTRSLPLPIKSAAGSLAAGAWRIGLTPIDTYKTTMQVAGSDGAKLLAEKVAVNGPGVLFEGALATATATFVGHYPWYFTYNALGASLPPAPGGEPLLKLGRQAFLGLCSSCVSDCCSNSLRVVKTSKQTAPVPISYPEALKQVIDRDGVLGLFVRGLQTRILANALQGALFAVAWKYFQEIFKGTGGGV